MHCDSVGDLIFFVRCCILYRELKRRIIIVRCTTSIYNMSETNWASVSRLGHNISLDVTGKCEMKGDNSQMIISLGKQTSYGVAAPSR